MPRPDDKRAKQGRPKNPYSPYDTRAQVLGEQFQQTLGQQQRNVFIQPQRGVVDQPSQLSFGNMTPGPSGGLEVLKSLATATTAGVNAYNAVYGDRLKRDREKIDKNLSKEYVLLRQQKTDANDNPIPLDQDGDESFLVVGSKEHKKYLEAASKGDKSFLLIDDKTKTSMHRLTKLQDLQEGAMKDNRRYVRQNVVRIGNEIQLDLDKDLINEAGLAFNAANSITNPNRAADLVAWRDKYDDYAVPGSTFAEWFEKTEYTILENEATALDNRIFDNAKIALDNLILEKRKESPTAILTLTRADMQQTLIDAGVYDELLDGQVFTSPQEQQQFLDNYFDKFEIRYRELDNIINSTFNQVETERIQQTEKTRVASLRRVTEEWQDPEKPLRERLELLDSYVDQLALEDAINQNYRAEPGDPKYDEFVKKTRSRLFRETFTEEMNKLKESPDYIQELASRFNISLADVPITEDFISLVAEGMAGKFDVDLDDTSVYSDRSIRLAEEEALGHLNQEQMKIALYTQRNKGHVSQDVRDDLQSIQDRRTAIQDAKTEEEKTRVLLSMGYLDPTDSEDAFLYDFFTGGEYRDLEEKLVAHYKDSVLTDSVEKGAGLAIDDSNMDQYLTNPEEFLDDSFNKWAISSGLRYSDLVSSDLGPINGNPDVINIMDEVGNDNIVDFMTDLLGPDKVRELGDARVLELGMQLKEEVGDLYTAWEKGISDQVKIISKAREERIKKRQQAVDTKNNIKSRNFSLNHMIGGTPNPTNTADDAIAIASIATMAPTAISSIFDPSGLLANTPFGSAMLSGIEQTGGLPAFITMLKTAQESGDTKPVLDFIRSNGLENYGQEFAEIQTLMDPSSLLRSGFDPTTFQTEAGRLGATALAMQMLAYDDSNKTIVSNFDNTEFKFKLSDSDRALLAEAVLTAPKNARGLEATQFVLRNVGMAALSHHAATVGLKSPDHERDQRITAAMSGGEDFFGSKPFREILTDTFGFTEHGANTLSFLGTIIPNLDLNEVPEDLRPVAEDILRAVSLGRDGQFTTPINQESYGKSVGIFSEDPKTIVTGGAGGVAVDTAMDELTYYYLLMRGESKSHALKLGLEESEKEDLETFVESYKNDGEDSEAAAERLVQSLRQMQLDNSIGLSMMPAVRTTMLNLKGNPRKPSPSQLFGLTQMVTDMGPGRSMLPDGRIVPDAATDLPAQYDYAGTTIPLSQDQRVASSAIMDSEFLSRMGIHPENYQTPMGEADEIEFFVAAENFRKHYQGEFEAGAVSLPAGIIATELLHYDMTNEASPIVDALLRGRPEINGQKLTVDDLFLLTDPNNPTVRIPDLHKINALMLPIIDQEVPAEGEEGGTFVDTPSDVPFFRMALEDPIGFNRPGELIVEILGHRRVIPIQTFTGNAGDPIRSFIGDGKNTPIVQNRLAAGINKDVITTQEGVATTGSTLRSRAGQDGTLEVAALTQEQAQQQFNRARADYTLNFEQHLIALGFKTDANGQIDFSTFLDQDPVQVTIAGKPAMISPENAIVLAQASLAGQLYHSAHLLGIEIDPQFSEFMGLIEQGEVSGVEPGEVLSLSPALENITGLSLDRRKTRTGTEIGPRGEPIPVYKSAPQVLQRPAFERKSTLGPLASPKLGLNDVIGAGMNFLASLDIMKNQAFGWLEENIGVGEFFQSDPMRAFSYQLKAEQLTTPTQDYFEFKGDRNAYPINPSNIARLRQSTFDENGNLTYSAAPVTRKPSKPTPASITAGSSVVEVNAAFDALSNMPSVQRTPSQGSPQPTAPTFADPLGLTAPLSTPEDAPAKPTQPQLKPDPDKKDDGITIDLSGIASSGGGGLVNMVVAGALAHVPRSTMGFIDDEFIQNATIGFNDTSRSGETRDVSSIFLSAPILAGKTDVQKSIIRSFQKELKNNQKLNNVLRNEGMAGFTKFAPKDPSKYWGRFSPDFSSSEFNLSDVYDYEGYFTDWAKNLVRDDYQGESGRLFVDRTQRSAWDFLDEKPIETFEEAVVNPSNWDFNIDIDADAVLENLRNGEFLKTDNLGLGFSFKFTWEF